MNKTANKPMYACDSETCRVALFTTTEEMDEPQETCICPSCASAGRFVRVAVGARLGIRG